MTGEQFDMLSVPFEQILTHTGCPYSKDKTADGKRYKNDDAQRLFAFFFAGFSLNFEHGDSVDDESCPPCVMKGYTTEDLEKLTTHEVGKVYKFVRGLIAAV